MSASETPTQTLFLERPRSGERAVLVHVELPGEEAHEDLQEFKELAISAGARPVACLRASRRQPDSRFFVGEGKVETIRGRAQALGAELVIFSHALSPAQERNLEQRLECRVLDRIGLILDIFAQRAHTFEGKLQVELAQLKHLSTRLVRGWSHLERQKGGIGLRGPGEKQLETDRRLVAERIRTINRRLERVRKRRELSRTARRKATLPVVSLVGYTNAGKSTLFNRLSGADVLVRDRLFATLDPTLRRVPLSDAGSAILADTVGFIRHLPHELVAAFRATLEETREASLLVHVVDGHARERDAQVEQVDAVLAQIGAQDVPQIQVVNKIDLVADRQAGVERDARGTVRRVWVSAKTGEGLDLLRAALAERLLPARVRRRIRLPQAEGRLRARLHSVGSVREEYAENGEWVMEVDIQPGALERLCRREGLAPERIAAREPSSRRAPLRAASG